MKKMVMMCAMVAAALCARADFAFRYSENDDGTITLTDIVGECPTQLVIPAEYEGKVVFGIASGFLRETSIVKSVVIEEGVSTIGEFVLTGGNPIGKLSEISIPSSVHSIGRGAFTINPIMSIKLADEENGRFCVVDGTLYDKVDRRTICSCISVRHVQLPVDCETIGQDTFSCGWSSSISQLETIAWPRSLKKIEQAAFHECRKLASGDLSGTQLEEIEEDAFVLCTSLATVRFPETLKWLTGHDFSCCSSLRSVYFMGDEPKVLMKTSHNKDMLDCIYVTTPNLDREYSDEKQYHYSYLSNVTTYVRKGSTGWGLVPGVWQGCAIKYYQDEPEEGFEEAHTFNGLVYAGEVMCGIVQVTTSKRTAKDQVKVGGFMMLTDGKKQTIKNVTEDIEGGKLNVETKAGKLGDMELEITDNGFTGSVGLMTVTSGDIGEDTGIVSGTLKMSYFDAKTNKLKTRSIKLGGVASGGEAAGTLDAKGEDTKTFEAVVE